MASVDSVSVIIPVYNSENTITRCLDSVINQTYKCEYQIVVINDGSTDNSLVVLEKYLKKNVQYKIEIINKPNGGAASARNAGLKIANGDLIALLDSDDEWLPTKLEKKILIMQSNPLIDFLGCARNNEVLTILGKKFLYLHKASVKELLIKMYPQTSTAIFKRKLYEQFGGYNETMTHAEDGDLWVRYCANSNFYYLPESLVITGGGKPSFGHSGLSADMKAMEKGMDFILYEAKKNGVINFPFFCTLFLFNKIKYLRRMLITKFR